MSRMTGGLHDCDINDPYVKELIDFGLDGIQKSTNNSQSVQISRVIQAKKQVVAGTMLHLSLEVIVDGPCSPSDDSSSVQPNKVWDRSWLNHREILHLKRVE